MKNSIDSAISRMAIVTAILLLLIPCRANQKEETYLRFWRDIRNFKKQDEKSFPPKHAILFVGSSSFKRWHNLQDDFPGYTIINRGFGGSTLPALRRYADDIIFPYNPKQVVIYCGENDLASSDTVTAGKVLVRFKALFKTIRGQFPDLPVTYISMKPSPRRRHLLPKMREGNQLIKDFLAMQKNAVFIDVYHPMLDDSGQPIPEIFLDDGLHMNAKGYALWKKILEPFLLKGSDGGVTHPLVRPGSSNPQFRTIDNR
jgi:lysophospholipase L1-like esterase